MEYTIKKMAELSGISPRTLRYYDEINLLKPARINSSGYRIYGEAEVDCLQKILTFRTLDFSLETIKQILNTSKEEVELLLHQQEVFLLEKREQVTETLAILQHTLKRYEEENKMSDEQKFEKLKKQDVTKNDTMYGRELRERYDEQQIIQSNEHYLNLDQSTFESMRKTENKLVDLMRDYLVAETKNKELRFKIFETHKKWLTYFGMTYSKEYHQGLALMYQEDERFKDYYNQKAVGFAEALSGIILEFVA